MTEAAAVLPLDEFGMQVCKDCDRKLPFSEFSRVPDMRLGIRKVCKRCHSKKSMAWVTANPDKALNAHLLRNFGITLEQYNTLLAEQGGTCAVCGALPTDARNHRRGGARRFAQRLVVDHDHVTGKVRGLLCSMCNTGIGALRDEAATVRLALEYLENRTCRTIT